MRLLLSLFLSLTLSASVFASKIAGESTNFVSLEGMQVEMAQLSKYQEALKKRESEIYEFKIRFSELVTNFSTTGIYNNQFQNDRKQLEQLEKSVLIWKTENTQQVDKTKELGMVLDQIYTSYQGMKKQGSKKERGLYTQYLKQAEGLIENLKDHQAEFLKHEKFLDKFLVDTKRWKNFLVSKIKSSLDNGLLRWNLNSFISAPFSTSVELISSAKEVVAAAFQFPYHQFLANEIAPLLCRIVFASFVFFLILGSINIIKQWPLAYRGSQSYRSFLKMVEIIGSYPRTLAMLSFIIVTLGNWGPLSYESSPLFLHYTITLILFSLAWVRVISPVLMVFIGFLNQMSPTKTFVIRTHLIYLLILFKSLGHYFSIDNDLLTLITGALLGWISFKFFYLSLCLRLSVYEGTSEKLRVFFKAIKTFFIIFTGAIFVSSIFQLIGFFNLGIAIQSVVAHNLTLLLLSWAFYQIYGISLDDLVRRLGNDRQYKYLCDLFSFLRSNGSFIFSLFVGALLLESWYKAVFVFGDFWKSAIFSAGDYHLTVERLCKIIFTYYLFRVGHILSIYAIDRLVIKQSSLDRSSSSNYFVIVRYLFILVFLFVIAAILGFTYKNLLIFASALGVGIGFGLQNIVNNFISGIILLFERPIRVGDIIDVDGLFCQVKQIGIRSTIVETPDNSSVILPNSDILSNKVINWTLNGNTIAIRCDVGVAYGSDTHFVRDILQGVASGHPDVLEFPTPQVWFTEFADSSLNFVVKAWIIKPDDRATIKSDILHRINQRFNECGIEIPFPQRDIHIKSHPKT